MQISHVQHHNILSFRLLLLLIISSALIAAAGYIINDYFDINIDQINKPGKMVVEKYIKRRTAILLHFIFTVVGILLSIYVGWFTNFIVPIANVACCILLWFYSTTFKKKLLTGNILISLLTAWTIVVLYVAMFNIYADNIFTSKDILESTKRIYMFTTLYAGFAFIISLVREVVKDMEDMEGDARYGCKTMPLVWGVTAAKVFAAVWLVVLIGAILLVQFYALYSGWWWSCVYSLLFLILPLVWIFNKLYNAQTSLEFHKVSSVIKLVMLFGILSMVVIKLYL